MKFARRYAQVLLLLVGIFALWLPGTQIVQSQSAIKIAIVNPDHYRVVRFAYLHGEIDKENDYRSIAMGEAADSGRRSSNCPGGWTNPACWTGVGNQSDFLGTLLSNAGYQVDYFTSDTLPNITPSDYGLVIVQDPLTDRLRSFPKSSDTNLPDLLEKVTSQLVDRLTSYFNAGGKLLLVGDAVRLLEDTSDPTKPRLNLGKIIQAHNNVHTLSNPHPNLPASWLFIRGNPFCGVDRSGSGTYTVENSSLLTPGTKTADLSFFDGNDIPKALVWSDTVYYPSDGISLLDVRVQGSGEYVLRGDICSPPVHTVTVDDLMPHFMGYTAHNGRKIFYVGSDTFFDYEVIDHGGAWHAGQFQQISYTTTTAGQQAFLNLVQLALATVNPLNVVINEVAWMGTEASSYDEWIELYNTTNQDIDLTNWTLVSDDDSPNFTFTSLDCSSLTIPAQGFLLLERTNDTTVSDVNADCIYTGNLSNAGETLTLKDPSDNVIDTANGDGGGWPAGVNPTDDPENWGTMERIDPLAPDSDANWVTNDGVDRNGLDANGDPINGTPKAQNSPFNKPPSCNDINVTTDEDTSVDIDLALHCNDPDTDPLTSSSLSDPPHGTAQFLSPTIRYTPDENFNGSDSFTFRVSDSELESNTATVDVMVNEVNDNPIADAGPDQSVDVGDTVQLDGSGSSDPDSDPLSYNWSFVAKPAGSAAALSDPAIVNPTFVADVAGDYALELTVDDGRGGTDSDQVTISAVRDGDVNGDGKIDMQDAILAAKFALGLLTPSEWQRKAADVVPPCGTIDARDVVRIAEVALGIKDESAFTCGGGSGQNMGIAIPASTRRAGTAQLRIGSREILPGERVAINISSSAALEGVQVGPEGSLSFDPRVIQVKAIRGMPPYQVLASEIDNKAGKAKFMVITIDEPRGREIIEIEVEAVGHEGKSTVVKLAPDMTLDAEGNELAVEVTEGRLILGKAIPLKIDRILSIPNPTRSRDNVRIVAEGQGIKDVRVQIYDLSGREVFGSDWVAGQTFEWNLMSNRGRVVANGVYLHIVTVRGFGEDELVRSSVKKLVVLR